MVFRRKHQQQPAKPCVITDMAAPGQQQSVEVEWNGYSYGRPNEKQYATRFRTELSALKQRLEQIKTRKRETQPDHPPHHQQPVGHRSGTSLEHLYDSTDSPSSQMQQPIDAEGQRHGHTHTHAHTHVHDAQAHIHAHTHVHDAQARSIRNISPHDGAGSSSEFQMPPSPKRLHHHQLQQQASAQGAATQIRNQPQIPLSLIKRKRQQENRLRQRIALQRQKSDSSSDSVQSVKSTDVQQDLEDISGSPDRQALNDNALHVHADPNHANPRNHHLKEISPPQSHHHHVSSKEKHRLEQERMNHFFQSTHVDTTKQELNDLHNQQQQQQRAMESDQDGIKQSVPPYYKAVDDSPLGCAGCCTPDSHDPTSASSWQMWLPDLSQPFVARSNIMLPRVSSSPAAYQQQQQQQKQQSNQQPDTAARAKPNSAVRDTVPPAPSSISMRRSYTAPKANNRSHRSPPRAQSNADGHANPAAPSSPLSSLSCGSIRGTPPTSPINPPSAPHQHSASSPHKSSMSCDTAHVTDASTDASVNSLSPPIPLLRRAPFGRSRGAAAKSDATNASAKTNSKTKSKTKSSFRQSPHSEEPTRRKFSLRKLLHRNRKKHNDDEDDDIDQEEYERSLSPRRRPRKRNDTWRIQPQVETTAEQPKVTVVAAPHKSEAIINHMEMIFFENHTDEYFDVVQ